MKYRVRNEAGDEREVAADKASFAAKDGYFPVVSDGVSDRRIGSLDNLERAAKDGFTPRSYVERYYEGQATLAADKGGDQQGVDRNYLAETVDGIGLGIDQAMTGGFSEELSAVGQAVSPLEWALNEGPDAPFWGGISERYDQALAQRRAENKVIEDKAPTATMVTDVAGGFMMPASKATGAWNVAKASAVMGGIEGVGRTEHDKLSQAGLTDAAMAAGFGGVAGGSMDLLGKGLVKAGDAVSPIIHKIEDGIADRARGIKEYLGRKALGYNKAMLKSTGGDRALEKANAAVDVALDHKVIKPFSDTEAMLERASDIKTRSGEAIGEAKKVADDFSDNLISGAKSAGLEDEIAGSGWRVEGGHVAQDVQESFGTKYSSGIDPKLDREYRQLIKGLTDEGEMSIERLGELKNIAGQSGWAPGGKEIEGPVPGMYRKVWSVLDENETAGIEGIFSGMEHMFDAGTLGDFKLAKQLYGPSKSMTKALTDKSLRESGNQFFDLPSIIIASGSMATGNDLQTGGVTGLAVFAGKKGLSKFGPQMGANLAHRLQKTLGSHKLGRKYAEALTKAARKGNASLAATHFMLQQRDPEYREATKDKADER